MARRQFQEPDIQAIVLEGGLDQTTPALTISPGKLITAEGVEIIGNKPGVHRKAGYERCVTDTLPSATTVVYIEIKTPVGTYTSGDAFTCAATAVTIRPLANNASPTAGDVLPCAGFSPTISVDDLFTDGTNTFTVAAIATGASTYTTSEMQDFRAAAIEQTRDNIIVVPGSGNILGGFRLGGYNYVFRNDGSEAKLYKGTAAYTWTEITLPEVLYFDAGVVAFTVGDTITDGAASAVVASSTRQNGSWDYSADDKSDGYLTLSGATGVFLDGSYLKKSNPDLITNGVDFTGASGATPPTGWTTTGSTVLYSVSNGTLTYDRNGEAVFGDAPIAQTVTVTNNQMYEFVVKGLVLTSGTMGMMADPLVVTAPTFETDGDHTYTFKGDTVMSFVAIWNRTDTGVMSLDSVALMATDEMVENNGFYEDTRWTKGTGWAIASEKATKTAGTGSDLEQDIGAVSGTVYSVVFTITNVTAGSVTPTIGTVAGTSRSADGTYKETITADGSSLLLTADAAFAGDISNISVKPVSVIGTAPNLDVVVNGSFSSDTIWTKGTGWSIAAGVATGAAGTASSLTQPFILDASRSVAITFTVSGYSAGVLNAALGDYEGPDVTADGTYTHVIATTAAVTTIGFNKDATFAGSIDNVSVVDSGCAVANGDSTTLALNPNGRYECKKHNFSNVADADSIFGVSGTNDAFQFDGTNYIPIYHPDATGYPDHIGIHQERLYLGFPGGELAYSVVVQPRVFNSLLRAGSHSCGAEIVGMRIISRDAFVVYCENSYWLLTGTGVYNTDTSTHDWQFVEYAEDVGAEEWTLAGLGDHFFLDHGDIRTLKTTAAYGGFNPVPIAGNIQPFTSSLAGTATAAMWVKSKSQYRIFFSGGKAAYVAFSGGKFKGATTVNFPDAVNVAWTAYEDQTEYMFFGSSDGYLYRMDSGNTCDDGYITGSFRLPYYHYGSPRNIKRFPQITFELDSPVLLTGSTSITYTVNHSYGKTALPRPIAETVTDIDGAGGVYGGTDTYGTFVWGGPTVSEIVAYLDGEGTNMSILVTFSTKYDTEFAFLNALVDYIPLGIARS